MIQRTFKLNGWQYENIGKNLWRIYRQASPYSITMTGSNKTTQLRIPWMHRWVRLHLYHTDSSKDASTDELDVILRRGVGTIPPILDFVDDLYARADITQSKIIKVFGEDYKFEASTWSIILNSTSTDLVFVLVYVEQLKKEMIPAAC